MASRCKKSILNARINFIFYIITLFLSFFSRKIFLEYLSADFIGLTGTLQNILSLLNIAELGIGGAIGFNLYKPIQEENKEKINELISLFGWFYRYVGLLVSLLEDTERERGGAALILCPEEKDCVKLGGLLERFGLRTGFYMARDLTFYNMTASHEYEHERIKVLSGLMAGEYDAVLTTPDAALGYTVPPEILKQTTVAINADEPLDLPELAKRLTGAGFVRVDLVDSPGQFALRGGIVDIYSPFGTFADSDGDTKSGAYALRIELFGDDIDRMAPLPEPGWAAHRKSY